MDCTTIDSATELHGNDDDHMASTSNINSITNNVVAVNDDVMVQVNNDPTTSGTSSTNNIMEQKVHQEDGDKCLDNTNVSGKIDDQDEMTKMMIATTMIVKGKRTKRLRIHSPITGENKCTNNQEDNVQVMMDEDEDMDMANCLILLAQGPSRPPLIRRNELGLFTSSRGSTMRFTSDNKRPSYNNTSVYECKTCNRTFPSFQALGGHRASHKKLKITTTNNESSQMVTVVSSSPSPLSLQLGNINYTRSTAVEASPSPITHFVAQNNSSNRNRIHECAICGAEFSSGQALGGHMRRHRGPIMPLHSSTTTTTTNKHPFANTTLSLTLSTAANNNVAAVTAVESKGNRVNVNDGFLSLDLNLPATPSPSPLAPIAPPTEHDATKLSKQQPQTSSGMVLSTSALVDCFY